MLLFDKGSYCRWREGMGPSIRYTGSSVRGTLLVAGFAASAWTLVEGKIGANTAARTQIIQGQLQDRLYGKRQRDGNAGLHIACEVEPRSGGIQGIAGSEHHHCHNDLDGANSAITGKKIFLGVDFLTI